MTTVDRLPQLKEGVIITRSTSRCCQLEIAIEQFLRTGNRNNLLCAYEDPAFDPRTGLVVHDKIKYRQGQGGQQ